MKYLKNFEHHLDRQEYYNNLDLDTDKTFVHLCNAEESLDSPAHLHYENCESTRGLAFTYIEQWPINQLSLLRYLESHYPVDDSSNSTLSQTQSLQLLQSYNKLNVVNFYNYGFDYLSNNFTDEAISIKGDYKLSTKMFQPLDEYSLGFGFTAGGGEADITLPNRSLFGLQNNSNVDTKKSKSKRSPSKPTTTIGKKNTSSGGDLLTYEYIGELVDYPNIAVNVGNDRIFNQLTELRNGGNSGGIPEVNLALAPSRSTKTAGVVNQTGTTTNWWLFLLFNDYVPVRLVDLCQKENDPTNLYAIYMTYNFCINNTDEYANNLCTNNFVNDNSWRRCTHTDFPFIFLVRHCSNATIEEIEEDGNTYKEVTFDETNTTYRVFIPNLQLYHHDLEDLEYRNLRYLYVNSTNTSSNNGGSSEILPNYNNDNYTHWNIIIDNDENNPILLDVNGPTYLDSNGNIVQLKMSDIGSFNYIKLFDNDSLIGINQNHDYAGDYDGFYVLYNNVLYEVEYNYNDYEVTVLSASNSSIQAPSNEFFERVINGWNWYHQPEESFIYFNQYEYELSYNVYIYNSNLNHE